MAEKRPAKPSTHTTKRKKVTVATCEICPGQPPKVQCVHTQQGQQFLATQQQMMKRTRLTGTPVTPTPLSQANTGLDTPTFQVSPTSSQSSSGIQTPQPLMYNPYQSLASAQWYPPPTGMYTGVPYPGLAVHNPPPFHAFYQGRRDVNGLPNPPSDVFTTVPVPVVPQQQALPPSIPLDPQLISMPLADDAAVLGSDSNDEPGEDQNQARDVPEVTGDEDDDDDNEPENEDDQSSKSSSVKKVKVKRILLRRPRPLPELHDDPTRRFNILMEEILARCERLGAETGCWLILGAAHKGAGGETAGLRLGV
ncbi:hypothetical protein C8R44DRAFT_867136 [Mycena epipterygia]|nr:hypothetical protein C8R44DRAFT_867136 [Mycena epipterygia]